MYGKGYVEVNPKLALWSGKNLDLINGLVP